MAERPYFGLSTADVYRYARSALRRKDATAFAQCLEELRRRRRAGDLVDELLELRTRAPERELPDVLRRGFAVNDAQDVALVVDDECHRRLEMCRAATKSIWLSTYTIKDGDGDLRGVLSERARRIPVNLIVSPGPIKPGGHADEVIEELREARVRVVIQTNHSKCVVVDEERVMIGSANLHAEVYRDVGMTFRSRSVAQALICYMQMLVRATR